MVTGGQRDSTDMNRIKIKPTGAGMGAPPPFIPSAPPLIFLAVCLFILALSLSACGGAETRTAAGNNEEPAIEAFLARAPVAPPKNATPLPTQAPTISSRIPLPEVDPLQVKGDISTTGSDALSGLTERLYRRFVADGYAGFIKLEELSTTDAFVAFCQGATDLVAATRPLLQEELENCLQHSRAPIVFPVGVDVLVVVVNAQNDFVQDVTITDLAAIFKAKRWSDVNTTWPKRKIIHLLPPTTSDDFLFFADILFAGNSRLLATVPNSTFLSDALETVQRVQDNPDAIGVINYTLYNERRNALRLVKIGGLQPEPTTIQDATYPLRRPLLLYSAPEVLQSKVQLSSFLTFYLTYINEEIRQEGKFPLTRADLERSRLNLLIGTANEAYLDDLRETATP